MTIRNNIKCNNNIIILFRSVVSLGGPSLTYRHDGSRAAIIIPIRRQPDGRWVVSGFFYAPISTTIVKIIYDVIRAAVLTCTYGISGRIKCHCESIKSKAQIYRGGAGGDGRRYERCRVVRVEYRL